MSTFTTQVEVTEGVEVDIRIDYDSSPAEPATLEYPGCNEELWFNKVEIKTATGWKAYDYSEEEQERFIVEVEKEADEDRRAYASAMEDY